MRLLNGNSCSELYARTLQLYDRDFYVWTICTNCSRGWAALAIVFGARNNAWSANGPRESARGLFSHVKNTFLRFLSQWERQLGPLHFDTFFSPSSDDQIFLSTLSYDFSFYFYHHFTKQFSLLKKMDTIKPQKPHQMLQIKRSSSKLAKEGSKLPSVRVQLGKN